MHVNRPIFRAIIFCALAVLGWLASYAATDDIAPSSMVGSASVASSTFATQVMISSSTHLAASTTTNAFVVRAIDGDTLSVRLDEATGTEISIRLLGINTPESVDPRRRVECFGKEASRATQERTELRRVRLDSDFEADDRDAYHRLLRNVILEDSTDLNVWLVQEGYAYAYLSYPLNKRRAAQLRRLQTEAKAAHRGLWNPKTCAGMR